MPNVRSRNKWRCTLPRRMSLDITRTDRWPIVPAEFLCGGFVTNSVKNYTLSDIDDNDNIVVPFDSSKAWMERVSINLLCTIAANLATPTFWLTDLWRDWTLWRDKRWSERTMWSRVVYFCYRIIDIIAKFRYLQIKFY